MHARVFIAVMLLAACRGDRAATKQRDDAGPRGSASAVSDGGSSVVPFLPRSDPGDIKIDELERDMRLARGEPLRLVPLLLERAQYRGALDDYRRALDLSEELVKARPRDADAWRLRSQALSRVHRFDQAREALARYAELVHSSYVLDPQASIESATGNVELALKLRAEVIELAPSAANITTYAVELAGAGRFTEAVALIPKAAAAAQRINTPQGTGWLYFQWGRIYELGGEPAAARALYEAANQRMPGTLDTTEQLIAMMIVTGDREKATDLARDAVTLNGHPTILTLAIELGAFHDRQLATTEWERYVAAFPEAFSDHAARYFLGVGENPARALELARVNFKNRQTWQARVLVIDAALASKDPAAACAVVDPILSDVKATQAARFAAWKALAACGRRDEAARLGSALGIAP